MKLRYVSCYIRGVPIYESYDFDGILYKGKKIPYNVTHKPYNTTKEQNRRLKQRDRPPII